jgi:hypothetical protein
MRWAIGSSSFRAWLFGVFAFVALGGAVGIVGLTAMSTAGRTREISLDTLGQRGRIVGAMSWQLFMIVGALPWDQCWRLDRRLLKTQLHQFSQATCGCGRHRGVRRRYAGSVPAWRATASISRYFAWSERSASPGAISRRRALVRRPA